MTTELRTEQLLTGRQRDTIMAALRYWQAALANGEATSDGSISIEMLDIAENGRIGADAALSDAEIDALCEELNQAS